jgi:hypothetical protein
MLACAIQAATQMTGVSAIQYYSVTIFVSSSQTSYIYIYIFICLSHLLTSFKKQIGITGTQTLKYQAINSVIGLIAEALIMLFVDKLGRRTIIIWGNLAMCCTFIISTILLARFPPSADNTGAHWGFIIMTWIFNFTFASMGSLCKKPQRLDEWKSTHLFSLAWIIPAEVFDTVTRSKGVALAAMTSFAFK